MEKDFRKKQRLVEANALKQFVDILNGMILSKTLEEIKTDIGKMKQKYKKYIEKLETTNVELKEDMQGFLTQFLDVLDAMEQFETLEEVKADIVMRKKIYKEYIEQLSK